MLDVIKNDIVLWTGLSRPALHALFGFGIFAIVLMVWRAPSALLAAWLTAFAVQAANEVLDIFGDLLALNRVDLADCAGDFWVTMALPTMLAVGIWLLRQPVHHFRYSSESQDGAWSPGRML